MLRLAPRHEASSLFSITVWTPLNVLNQEISGTAVMFVSTTNEVVIRRPRSRGLVCCLCIPRSLNQTIAYRARHDAIILGSDRSEQARRVTVRTAENCGIRGLRLERRT